MTPPPRDWREGAGPAFVSCWYRSG